MRASIAQLLDGSIEVSTGFAPTNAAIEAFRRAADGDRCPFLVGLNAPASALTDLASVLNLKDEVDVAVQASRVPKNREEWEATLEKDAVALNAFLEEAPASVDVIAYEIFLPEAVTVVDAAKDLSGFREVDVYIGLNPTSSLADRLAALAETEWLGVYGALSTGADPLAVADLLLGCLNLDLPCKLSLDRVPALTVGASEGIGIINLLGGLAVARANDFSVREFARLLGDGTPGVWTATEQAVAWRGHEAARDDIEETRAVLQAIIVSDVEGAVRGLESVNLSSPTSN